MVARALGTPLTPWQRYVADVAGERRSDGSYEHRIVVVSVPRQSGKTALIRAMGVHRAMLGRGVFYTAQTGKDARARWTDLVKALRLAPAFQGKMKAEEIRVALRGGSEHVAFPGGGVFQCFAPTVDSLHGYTPPTVAIDEAFAQTAASGELLMGAIEPAQRTIVDRQIWLVSTRGTAESTFFHDWVGAARDGRPRVALFDWGADDDQDPFDVDDIAAFHPAVGQEFVEIGQSTGLVTTAADILAAADNIPSRAEYIRAYGNRETLTSSHLIPPGTWRELGGDLEMPDDLRDVRLAYDVDEHNQGAAIVALWHGIDGRPTGKVVEYRPGPATWLAAGVDDLVTSWHTAAPIAVGNGPVLDVTAQLRRLGHNVDELSEREWTAATTGLLTLIEDDGIRHDAGDVLATAATGLATRNTGDGVAFSRRLSVGCSSPAIAYAAGLQRLRHADTGAPVVRFAS